MTSMVDWMRTRPGLNRAAAAPVAFWITLAVGVALLAIWVEWRWVWLDYGRPFNPDEGQQAASAIKAEDGFGIWRHVNLSNFGPLNGVAGAWPLLFGKSPTLETTRLTGFVFEVGAMIVGAVAVYIFTRRFLPLLAFVPLALLSARTANPDYLQFASEKTSLIIVAASLVLMALLERRRTNLALALLTGIFIGSLPFLKLQTIYFGLYLGASAVGLTMLNREPIAARLRSTAVLVAGALLPLIYLAFPLVISNDLTTLTISYVMFARDYAHPDFGAGLLHLLTYSFQFGYMFWLSAGAVLTIVVGIIAALQRRVRLAVLCAWSIGLAITALITIGTPGEAFYHYTLYLAYPGPVIVAAGIYGLLVLVPEGSGWRSWKTAAIAGVVALCAFSSVRAVMDMTPGYRYLTSGVQATAIRLFPDPGPALLDWAPTESDYALVWGWQADIYVDAQKKSVSRESINVYQMFYKRMEHFRDMLRRDWPRYDFDILVDAVTDVSMLATRDAATKGFDVLMPDLFADPTKNWRQLNPGNDPACPRTYLSQRSYEELYRRLIPVTGAEVSDSVAGAGADRLHDFSVYENCTDFWAPPPGALGQARIEFSDAAVGEIWLLNTEEGTYASRQTDTVDVTLFLDGDPVWSSSEISMKRYPTWTVIETPAGVTADTLTVDLKSFSAGGAGLNEVMLFRADQ